MKVKQRAIDKIFKYAKKANHDEIGGILIGKKYTDGSFTVTECVLLEYIKDKAGFRITDKGMLDFTKNATAVQLENVIGWWHSHASMDTFWSPDDTATFKRLAKFFERGVCIGVVVNTKGSSRWRIMVETRTETFIDVDDIPVQVLRPLTRFNININDFREKTLEAEPGLAYEDACTECPICRGAGFVVQKRSFPKGFLNDFDDLNNDDTYYYKDFEGR